MPGFTPGGLAPSSAVASDVELLERAEAAVRDYCRWHIAPERIDPVSVEGSGTRLHVLPTRKLVSVANVALAGTLMVEGVHFTVDLAAGILIRRDGLRWIGRLSLVMTHGYDYPPPAVQAVIADVAGQAPNVGQATTQMGPFTTTRGAESATVQGGAVGLSGEQMRALTPYRLEPSV